ncbi:uncharacterized protein LOC116259085 isoform X2 [Nymphaea colorata]|uniref:uncharacterized protein LOC116259085 isoform X2 n=1 Tax=Nymphaea colorata TaxID=210225 RepID=UPI00129DEE36|nr:uncharacterized protein LOC116259085 isoform X2 [Nymphaea colorata]
MEALRELQDVQAMLSFIGDRGISSGDASSDRFLASFLLFMARSRSTEMGPAKRMDLIAECLPKLSAGILQEAQTRFAESGGDKDAEGIRSAALSSVENVEEEFAVIGLDAMRRANSTVEDFVRSYFMFHGMDANNPGTVFRFLPILYFTESYIYQLDNINEIISNQSSRVSSKEVKLSSQWKVSRLMELFETDPFRPLCRVLEQHGLMTERISKELGFGVEYWALERHLCNSLTLKKNILCQDVMRAIHLKSFDYRILSFLLYKLRGQEVNESHMEFLSVSEFLVEVADDLFDYEDDIVGNNFNILRMLTRVYGAAVAPSILAKCIADAEERYETLLKKLDPDLATNYQKRCEDATKEGGRTFGPSLGTWNIPRVISDEESFRRNILKTKEAVNSS